MSDHPSLSRRLVLYLVLAQLAAFGLVGVCMMPLYAIFDLDHAGVTIDDWAEERAEMVILSAIALRPGAPHFEPSAELRDYLEKFPRFKFAAYTPADMTPLSGSSPEIANAVSGQSPLRFKAAYFTLGSDQQEPRNCVIQTRRDLGPPLLVAACNYGFAWSDSLFILWDYARSFFWSANSLFYLPLVGASLLIAWLVVRHGLEPLRDAAAGAQRINLDSLEQRLPEAKMPAEIMPLVSAINGALARLDAGVARQRRFTANAAHELRTPIAILRSRVDNPESANLREDLRRNLRRMRTIVEQLLALARLHESPAPSFEVIDLGETLLQIVADYVPLVVENAREIEFEQPSAPVLIRGDRRALESIVSNLIDNALKAEARGGSILVRVTSDAVIEVIDHGEGVAESDRDLIFEPFWRKTDASPGVGLGLAIVKELVDAHRGRIWVEQTEGGGATFRVQTPPLDQSSLAQPRPDAAPA